MVIAHTTISLTIINPVTIRSPHNSVQEGTLVAHGNPGSTVVGAHSDDLPMGWALTSSGRLSGVTQPGDISRAYPFAVKDLVTLDDALKYGSRQAQTRFAVYIGDLGSDTAARALEILQRVPTADNAVLLAVSPDQRVIEIVYGAQLQGRGADSAASLGVSAAIAAFTQDNLIDGVISAVRVMSAGIARK